MGRRRASGGRRGRTSGGAIGTRRGRGAPAGPARPRCGAAARSARAGRDRPRLASRCGSPRPGPRFASGRRPPASSSADSVEDGAIERGQFLGGRVRLHRATGWRSAAVRRNSPAVRFRSRGPMAPASVARCAPRCGPRTSPSVPGRRHPGLADALDDGRRRTRAQARSSSSSSDRAGPSATQRTEPSGVFATQPIEPSSIASRRTK